MRNNMNNHNQKILDFVRKNKVVTSNDVAKFLGVSWNTADKYLLELAFGQKIERIKKAGVNLWLKK